MGAAVQVVQPLASPARPRLTVTEVRELERTVSTGIDRMGPWPPLDPLRRYRRASESRLQPGAAVHADRGFGDRFGPVRFRHEDDFLGRVMATHVRPRAVYSVLKTQPATYEAMWPLVWIVDHDGARSITNDAEAVCHAVNAEHPGHRIIYRDTAGFWDELVHENGVFKRFAEARHLAPEATP